MVICLQSAIVKQLGADIIEWAGNTFWLLACANVSTVKKQPVVSMSHIIRGNGLYKTIFNLLRSVCRRWDQSQSMAYAIHMCVYRHSWLSIPNSKQDICCFAPYPWQASEFFKGIWYFVVKFIMNHVSHSK